MDNIALVLQAFSQNLRFLSNLQALNPANFNTTPGQPADNSFTVGIVVPSPTGRKFVGTPGSPFYISMVPSPSTNTLLGSDFRVLSPPIANFPSPFSIFSYNYTNASASSNLLFNVGCQVSNTFGTITKVDIELWVNSVKQFSSRVYTGFTDIGSTSFSVAIPMSAVGMNNIQLIARETPDSNINLNIPNAYISIMES